MRYTEAYVAGFSKVAEAAGVEPELLLEKAAFAQAALKFVSGPKSIRQATYFMNQMRNKLVERLKTRYGDMVQTTFGYVTRIVRTAAELPKDHNTDARTISGNANAKPNGIMWRITKNRCHRRNLHREVPGKGGIRQSRRPLYKVQGFGLHDQVLICKTGQIGYIAGLRTSGSFVIKDDNGDPVAECTYKRLKLLERAGGIRMVPSASS